MLDSPAAANGDGGDARDHRIRSARGRCDRGHTMAAMESRTMSAAIATLVAGLVVGYLGQRSRMCFIGGIRDFILVRDGYLLRGLIAFGLTAWLTFPVMAAVGGASVGPFGHH